MGKEHFNKGLYVQSDSNQIKDGTYVKTSMGNGIYYVSYFLCRKEELFLKAIKAKPMVI